MQLISEERSKLLKVLQDVGKLLIKSVYMCADGCKGKVGERTSGVNVAGIEWKTVEKMFTASRAG